MYFVEGPDDVLLLDGGENVLFSIKQKKYRPAINIESAMITSKRIVMRRPSMERTKKEAVTTTATQDPTNICSGQGSAPHTIMLNLSMDADDPVIQDILNQMAE